jgi:lipoprotein NlpD
LFVKDKIVYRYLILILVTTGLMVNGCAYGIWHKVRRGENVSSLASLYGVSANKIRDINDLENGDEVPPGDPIFIPYVFETKTARAVSSAPSSPRATRPQSTRTATRKPPPSAKPPASPRPKPKATPDLFTWPLRGKVTSGFGKRGSQNHQGLDIAAPTGTSIVAAASGKVIYSGDSIRGYGNMVIIKHQGVYATVYSHNSRNLAEEGDIVEKGQKIAEVGSTGRASGPHLHFEIRINNKATDPAAYLPK